MLQQVLGDRIDLKTFTHSDDAITFVLQNQKNIFFYAQDSSHSESKIINSWKRKRREINIPYGFQSSIAGDFYSYVIDSFTPYASCNFCTAMDMRVPIMAEWSKKDPRISYLRKPVVPSSIAEVLTNALARWEAIDQDFTISADEKFLISISEELISVCGHDESFLDKLTSRQFEEVIDGIFKNHGCITEVTAKTRDGGYDIRAISSTGLKDEVMLIEVKHFAQHRAVGVGVIRELYGVKKLLNADKALLVTSSYVSPDAKKQFERVIPIELDIAERPKVIQWCKDYLNPILQ